MHRLPTLLYYRYETCVRTYERLLQLLGRFVAAIIGLDVRSFVETALANMDRALDALVGVGLAKDLRIACHGNAMTQRCQVRTARAASLT